MGVGVTDSTHYSDIAAAIRNKNGSSSTYWPSQMAAAISAIKTGEDMQAFRTGTVGASTTFNIDTGLSTVNTFVVYSLDPSYGTQRMKIGFYNGTIDIVAGYKTNSQQANCIINRSAFAFNGGVVTYSNPNNYPVVDTMTWIAYGTE